MGAISWEDFEKVELRVGTIVDVQDFPVTKTEVSGFSVFLLTPDTRHLKATQRLAISTYKAIYH